MFDEDLRDGKLVRLAWRSPVDTEVAQGKADRTRHGKAVLSSQHANFRREEEEKALGLSGLRAPREERTSG